MAASSEQRSSVVGLGPVATAVFKKGDMDLMSRMAAGGGLVQVLLAAAPGRRHCGLLAACVHAVGSTVVWHLGEVLPALAPLLAAPPHACTTPHLPLPTHPAAS